MKVLMNKKICYGIFVFITVALLGVFSWFVGRPMIEFASEPDLFRDWVESSGVWGRLAYIGMMMLQIIAAFLPGEPFEMVAGYAFGAVEGTLLCFFASAIGSCFVLVLVRIFGMKLVRLFFSDEKINSVKFLKSSPRRIFLFSLIFMLPGTPKDLLCYFIGITDIKLWILMLICSFGRIPAIITSTLGGDALGTESYIWAIVILSLTVIISLSGVLVYRIISKNHNKT